MEEDIKVLERVCKARKFDGIYTTNEAIFEAIENLIARNKELEEKNFYLPAWVGKNYIPKSKVREKIEERFGILCMQLGSYEKDNATSEQERIAGGINELRKLKKDLLEERR